MPLRSAGTVETAQSIFGGFLALCGRHLPLQGWLGGRLRREPGGAQRSDRLSLREGL
jgi:hypothetical protein